MFGLKLKVSNSDIYFITHCFARYLEDCLLCENDFSG